MKYAVINPRGGVNRVSPKAITGNPEGTTVVKLTDKQAAQVEAGRTSTPRVLYFWQDDALITMADKQAAIQAKVTATQEARLAERTAAQEARLAERTAAQEARLAERTAAQEARLAERTALMTPEEKIGLAKAHVAQTFDAFDLISMMDKLAQVKDVDALAANPKLVATYTWIQTVQGMAVAGQTAFPPAPHTFLEIRSE